MAFQAHIKNENPKDFIAGWYINPKTCDQLIDFFECNQQHQVPGVVGDHCTIDPTIKQSTDLTINKFKDGLSYPSRVNFGGNFEKYTKIRILNGYNNIIF